MFSTTTHLLLRKAIMADWATIPTDPSAAAATVTGTSRAPGVTRANGTPKWFGTAHQTSASTMPPAAAAVTLVARNRILSRSAARKRMTALGSPNVPAITTKVSALTTVAVVPTALAGKIA